MSRRERYDLRDDRRRLTHTPYADVATHQPVRITYKKAPQAGPTFEGKIDLDSNLDPNLSDEEDGFPLFSSFFFRQETSSVALQYILVEERKVCFILLKSIKNSIFTYKMRRNQSFTFPLKESLQCMNVARMLRRFRPEVYLHPLLLNLT